MEEKTCRSILDCLKAAEAETENTTEETLSDTADVSEKETAEEKYEAEDKTEGEHIDDLGEFEDRGWADGANHKKKRTVSWMILSNPILTFVLLCVFAAMCAVAAFAVPSAGTVVKEDNIVAQRNAAGDIESGVGLVTKNIVNDVQGMPKLFLLPVTDTPGAPYSSANKHTYKDEKGITHSVYEDPSITVDLWKVKKKIDGRSYVASYAKVKVAHPTQLRTSVSKTGYRDRSRPSEQAKKMNAIVAVNGDFFTLRSNGVIIRQGTYYRKKRASKETLFIDSDGNFHFMSSTEAIDSGFLDSNTIYNSLFFGPVLVRDGVLCQYKNSTKDHLPTMHYGRNPRTGIGQIGELEYLLIVVDGRTRDSAGLSTSQFAKLFYEQGCINAYNLDGGQSSCMVYTGKVYNTVSNAGERLISDIVYFASAMPDEDEI